MHFAIDWESAPGDLELQTLARFGLALRVDRELQLRIPTHLMKRQISHDLGGASTPLGRILSSGHIGDQRVA